MCLRCFFFQDSPTFVSPSVDYFDFLLFSLGLIHVISRCRILKWQAIAWTIENPVRWLMCMSLGSQLPLCPGWLIIHKIPKKIHRYVLGNNDILIFNPVYRVESYMITEDYKKQRRLLCTDISLLYMNLSLWKFHGFFYIRLNDLVKPLPKTIISIHTLKKIAPLLTPFRQHFIIT